MCHASAPLTCGSSEALAKRQETWFRLTPGVEWIDLTSEEDLGRAPDVIQDRLDRAGIRP